MPATLQNYWMLNVQFASFWASPSYFSGFFSFMFEPVNVPGPVTAGGAGGAVVVPAVLPCMLQWPKSKASSSILGLRLIFQS